MAAAARGGAREAAHSAPATCRRAYLRDAAVSCSLVVETEPSEQPGGPRGITSRP